MNRERLIELWPVMEHFKNGGEIDYRMKNEIKWTKNINPRPVSWLDDFDYRKAVTKPSIDWSHVNEMFKYLTMDKDKFCIIHDNKPLIDEDDGMWTNSGKVAYGKQFASFKPGTCDWKDSLVKRPE